MQPHTDYTDYMPPPCERCRAFSDQRRGTGQARLERYSYSTSNAEEHRKSHTPRLAEEAVMQEKLRYYSRIIPGLSFAELS
jgi:hypothetical protein